MKNFLATFRLLGAMLLAAFAVVAPALAQLTVNVSVVGEDGASVSDFRWLLEEDNTTFHDPSNPHGNAPGAPHNDVLGMQFHRSYSATVSSGCVGSSEQAPEADDAPCRADGSIVVPEKGRYFLSVMPFDGRRMTGVAINSTALSANASLSRNVTLKAAGSLNAATGAIEVPAAQMTVFAFLDEAPINNAPDAGEPGLAGFQVIIEDAGGKYGASGGQLVADVFGNPLGTTYMRNAAGEYSQFDADGVPVVQTIGTGELKTGPDGLITIRNLAPAKYGVKLIPPNNGVEYQQVTTIEGTPIIDTWLLPNEGNLMVEFGAPSPYHIFTGFTRRTPLKASYQTGGVTVSGTVHAMHTPRPPLIDFNFGPRWDVFNGASPCWIGVNDMGIDGGQMIMAEPCEADSHFTIPNLRDGSYQIVIWDRFLDGVIAFYPLTVADGKCSATGVNPTVAACSLGKVGMFPWFARVDNYVFFDANLNGRKDKGELGIPEQVVNLRFRDGTIFQSFPTDLGGYVPFDQVFPFFNWLVAEVDFGRFKATGLTAYVDEGGELDSNRPGSRYGDIQNPQLEGYTGGASGKPFRTDKMSVLTQAYQAFLGTTSVIEWGKANYGAGESGGISGIVYYAVTRAEDDPTNAAAEPWEPGIPRVQMGLYLPCPNPGAKPAGGTSAARDAVCETYRDPQTNKWMNGTRQKVSSPTAANFANRAFIEPDVDNYPLNFRNCTSPTAAGCTIGPEDIDTNGNGRFDPGDAVSVTWTDSFDDSAPDYCPPSKDQVDAGTANMTQAPFVAHPGTAEEFSAGSCFDGLRPFNQIRPGVFDGGYAFEKYTPTGARQAALGGVNQLIDGDYVVQSFTPPALKQLTSQARNVDFGEVFGSNKIGFDATIAALPFDCAGPKYLVPDKLTLFPGVDAPLAGTYQALCNMRTATVRTGLAGGGFNAGAEFWMYTDVPKAGHIAGVALDDFANTSDPNSPAFGEKYAPPFLPVSIRDYKNTEISRVYTDEFGHYNALVPSSYSVNLPSQSGLSPNMLQACLNDPVRADGSFDPAFKREYGTVCYTLQYVAGSTTYLDTPILRLAAFASNNSYPLDCECKDQTPVIHHVENGSNTGVFTTVAADTFTVFSMGDTLVPNPDFDQNVQPAEVARDFGFGSAPGTVKIGGVTQAVSLWTNDMIRFDRNVGTPATGDLVITRANGAKTDVGVQIIFDNNPTTGLFIVEQGMKIQDAIDAADEGDVVVVKSGRYDESLILTKNIRLQGVGARSTVVNGQLSPGSRVTEWQSDIANRVAMGEIDLMPEQAYTRVSEVLLTEIGAPLSVFGRGANGVAAPGSDFAGGGADGFLFTGGDNGGGVLVNAYAPNFTLSNDIIAFNAGDYGGGVRVGLPTPATDPVNDNFVLRNSRITQNGGGVDPGGEGPGGVALYAGADGYLIEENFICGNFSLANGAGIGHVGLSDEGRIRNNKIVFNQSFDQAAGANGGGLFIAGAPLVGEGLSAGAGDVWIVGNLIQGNQAGAGDGGAIATNAFNGSDAIPGDALATYSLRLINNTIVNNVTGGAGVIVLDDVANSRIIHNTIAHNDSTATAATAFTGPLGFSQSVRQVSGVYAQQHSADLLDALGVASGFANPEFLDNIVWQNRSCYWSDTGVNGGQGIVCDDAGTVIYDEFGVQGDNGCVNIDYSVITDLGDTAICPASTHNVSGDPAFVGPSFLTSPSTAPFAGNGGRVEAFATLDEGGNFIDVPFGLDSALDPGGQLTLKGNFHLTENSPAVDIGFNTGVANDIDGDARPSGPRPDAGSDEIIGSGANTIQITQATAEYFRLAGVNRAAIGVIAKSDLEAAANLKVSLKDANGQVVVQDLSMSYLAGSLKEWRRSVLNIRTNRNPGPYTVTVTGSEGSTTTSTN